ncbi:hypothetical protein D9613_012849 [Agrocybe pediades]|uniref:PRP1 splicing factor N-terminal domain-containing protein n=1 Tax=Agrocybe pediades TaxID=84607 RepID=A0A8H4QXA5_9AGAR|nr:hypothetical protein D9613_012849 [Agrocybe pediades]
MAFDILFPKTTRPPASYVGGLGRGASGFTTRSDIGPAREGPSAEVIVEAQARWGEEVEPDPEQFQGPDNEYGLYAGTTYEQDDEEADKIYEAVDKAMDLRRRARREAQEQAELAKLRAERPKIQPQFADLKRGLSAPTDEEWESIPEVGNLTRTKRRRKERSCFVPDSVLVGDRSKTEFENALDERQQLAGGFDSSLDNGALTNFVEIGQARDKILSLKLDQISGAQSTLNGTSTSVDPKGYLTSLDSVGVKSSAESAISSARECSACLEEHAGKMVAARKIIKQGCEHCPKSEDVWLEAASLHYREYAKIVLANAVQHVDQSVKIWLAAADLEHDLKAKKHLLRKALERIPNSVRLWKETVNLESSASDARILLARAVEFIPIEVIPLFVELWLALAGLESPDKAKAVLNKARKAIPTSHEIWIAAGRLLEQEACLPSKSAEQRNKELEMVDKTIEGAVRDLGRHQVLLTRERWLKEAEKCEEEGSPRTCEAIVKAMIGMDVEEDRLDTWVNYDAEAVEAKGRVGTARAILAFALKVYPDKRSLWRRAAELEKAHGTRESLDTVLERAVRNGSLATSPAARQVLERTFVANPENEQIWLAAVKLEAENGEFGVARELLIRARTVADKDLDEVGRFRTPARANLDSSRNALYGPQEVPEIREALHDSRSNPPSRWKIAAARSSFAAGIKACPKEPTLWILASRLGEADGRSIKARPLLEKARLVNPGTDTLCAEPAGVEERSGGAQQAKSMLSRALQERFSSGLLWSLALWAEPRASRKTKSVDALRKTKDSPL